MTRWKVFTDYARERQSDPRDDVIFHKLASGLTYERVSQEFGITRTRVRQLFRRACARRDIEWTGRGTLKRVRDSRLPAEEPGNA